MTLSVCLSVHMHGLISETMLLTSLIFAPVVWGRGSVFVWWRSIGSYAFPVCG